MHQPYVADDLGDETSSAGDGGLLKIGPRAQIVLGCAAFLFVTIMILSMAFGIASSGQYNLANITGTAVVLAIGIYNLLVGAIRFHKEK